MVMKITCHHIGFIHLPTLYKCWNRTTQGHNNLKATMKKKQGEEKRKKGKM
jgi:hypothetical protein